MSSGLKKQAPNSLGTTTASGAGTSAAGVVPKSNGVSSFEEKLENMSYQEKVNQILSFEWVSFKIVSLHDQSIK